MSLIKLLFSELPVAVHPKSLVTKSTNDKSSVGNEPHKLLCEMSKYAMLEAFEKIVPSIPSCVGMVLRSWFDAKESRAVSR